MDNKIETVENQKKCILPYNSTSQTLFYNQRLIISAPVDEGVQPTAWRVTKVENTNPVGIQRLTFAQDKYDQHHDYIERDSRGYVIGMWADYYQSSVAPSEEVQVDKNESNGICNKITFNGTRPEIKIGGSYKKLTATFYDSLNQEVDYIGLWTFSINGQVIDIADNDVLEVVTQEDDSTLNTNQIKIKFIGSYDYVGEVLTVSNELNETHTQIELAINAL